MKIQCCTPRKWYPVNRNREARRSCQSNGGHDIESFLWVRHLLGRVCGLPLLFLGNVARRGDGLEEGVLEIVTPEMATEDNGCK